MDWAFAADSALRVRLFIAVGVLTSAALRGGGAAQAQEGPETDDTGLDLPDLQTATREAIRAAKSYRAEAAMIGENLDHQVVEVCDENGKLLASAPLKEHAS